MLKKRINSCDGIYNDFLDVRFTKIFLYWQGRNRFIIYQKIVKPEINANALYKNGQLSNGWLNKERG